MKKNAGNLLMIAGAVLVSLALLLFLYNMWDAKRAENRAAQIMEEIREQEWKTQPERKNEVEDATETDVETEEAGLPATMMVDGNTYIGYLSIPAIGLELPVMSEWSYEGLKIAPGRYSGSLYTHDLVIAGHNYARHFSPIKWLEVGTEVDLTDAGQRIWHYQVSSVEQLNPNQVEAMTEPSDTDNWDLTLFTCTTGGQMRYAVRCRAVGIERRGMS